MNGPPPRTYEEAPEARRSSALGAAPLAVASALVAVTFLAGCKSAPAQKAPLDYQAVCEERATFSHTFALDCLRCDIGAEDKNACSCAGSIAPEALGACEAEGEAVRKRPECLEAERCVRRCEGGTDSCTCALQCFAEVPDCKPLGAARTACRNRVCARYCK